MRRVARAAFTVAACVTLAGCGLASYSDPASQAAPVIGATCDVADSGYVLTFTNTSDQPVQVTGFSVVFTTGAPQSSCASPPRNHCRRRPHTNRPNTPLN